MSARKLPKTPPKTPPSSASYRVASEAIDEQSLDLPGIVSSRAASGHLDLDSLDQRIGAGQAQSKQTKLTSAAAPQSFKEIRGKVKCLSVLGSAQADLSEELKSELAGLSVAQLESRAIAEGVETNISAKSRCSFLHRFHGHASKAQRHELINKIIAARRICLHMPVASGRHSSHRSGAELWSVLKYKLHSVGEMAVFLHGDVSKLYVRAKHKPQHALADLMETQAINTRWLLHPTSKGRQIWDLYMCVLLLYVAVQVPIRIGFNVTPLPTDPEFAVDAVVDFSFIVDVSQSHPHALHWNPLVLMRWACVFRWS